jgi:predicted esterase YcpF (UPF0227 family)
MALLSPYTGEPMVTAHVAEVITYKGVDVELVNEYWMCQDTGDMFQDERQTEASLAAIRDEYEKHQSTRTA